MDIKSYLSQKFFRTSLVEHDWDIATLGGIFLSEENLESGGSPGIVTCLEILDDKYGEVGVDPIQPFTFSPSADFPYVYQTYLGNISTLCEALQKDSKFCKLVSEGEVLYDGSSRLAANLISLAKQYSKVHACRAKDYSKESSVYWDSDLNFYVNNRFGNLYNRNNIKIIRNGLPLESNKSYDLDCPRIISSGWLGTGTAVLLFDFDGDALSNLHVDLLDGETPVKSIYPGDGYRVNLNFLSSNKLLLESVETGKALTYGQLFELLSPDLLSSIKKPAFNIKATVYAIDVNKKIYFNGERQGYTIRAYNERFLVCTKPFNLRGTVVYSIVDLAKGIRGTENLVFGMGAETDWQCWEMLHRLESGESKISHRNFTDLKIA